MEVPYDKNSTPGSTPKGTENMYSHNNLFMNVDSSVIRNIQKEETNPMSINQRMDKQTLV